MDQQKPSVSRIVHYTPRDAQHALRKGQPYPAMITHVFGPECVNLSVFNDGSFPIPNGDEVLPTSVNFDPDGKPGTWRWPPRT